MSDYGRFLEQMERGRRGEIPWIPVPYQSLQYQFGLGRAQQHIVGGQSSAGKTAFVDWTYVLGPYGWYRKHKDETDVKLKIIYFSYERPKPYKLAKWATLRLMLNHGIMLDTKTVLGWGTAERRLTDEEARLLKESESTFEHMLSEIVTLIDIKENPTGIWKHIRRFAYDNGVAYRMDDQGKVHRAFLKMEERDTPHGKRKEETEAWEPVPNPTKEQTPSSRWAWHYVPNDPNLITIIVIDHIGLVPHERTSNTNSQKGNLDVLSGYCQDFRDRFGFTPVLVSQFNRNEQDIQRRTNVQLEPEAQDFEGSSRMYHDADVALGLFNPWKYRLSDYGGYKVGKFVNASGHNRFRALKILKNSYGADDLVKGMWFIGETGYFEELPHADMFDDALYAQYANPRF